LRRWEELRPDLDAHGIRVVAVSTDTPEEIVKGRSKHGLQGTFLADPALTITDLFGLRNLNAAVRPPGLPGLPVPTTLLVDRNGIVRWKDQSEHYVQRSDPDVIRGALRHCL
jgi:peroxiredoxin